MQFETIPGFVVALGVFLPHPITDFWEIGTRIIRCLPLLSVQTFQFRRLPLLSFGGSDPMALRSVAGLPIR